MTTDTFCKVGLCFFSTVLRHAFEGVELKDSLGVSTFPASNLWTGLGQVSDRFRPTLGYICLHLSTLGRPASSP